MQFLDTGVDVSVVARLVIVVLKTVEVLQLLVDVGLSSSLTRFCHAFQLIVQLLDEVVDVPVVVHVLVYGVMKNCGGPAVAAGPGLSSSWTRLSMCPLQCTSWFVA